MIDRLRRYLTGLSFQRGLAIGALVGAAIAGSSLWAKFREAGRIGHLEGEDVTNDEGSTSQGR